MSLAGVTTDRPRHTHSWSGGWPSLPAHSEETDCTCASRALQIALTVLPHDKRPALLVGVQVVDEFVGTRRGNGECDGLRLAVDEQIRLYRIAVGEALVYQVPGMHGHAAVRHLQRDRL